jgi:CBS domain-containing protein
METDVVTIGPAATVRELAALLSENNISGVPVTDQDGNLLGVVSEEDLILQDAELHFPHYIQIFDGVIYLQSVKKFEQKLQKAFGTKVADVMTAHPITVGPDATLREVATIMSQKDVNRLPVVDDEGRLLGIIARGDVLRGIAALQVQPFDEQVREERGGAAQADTEPVDEAAEQRS